MRQAQLAPLLTPGQAAEEMAAVVDGRQPAPLTDTCISHLRALCCHPALHIMCRHHPQRPATPVCPVEQLRSLCGRGGALQKGQRAQLHGSWLHPAVGARTQRSLQASSPAVADHGRGARP